MAGQPVMDGWPASHGWLASHPPVPTKLSTTNLVKLVDFPKQWSENPLGVGGGVGEYSPPHSGDGTTFSLVHGPNDWKITENDVIFGDFLPFSVIFCHSLGQTRRVRPQMVDFTTFFGQKVVKLPILPPFGPLFGPRTK